MRLSIIFSVRYLLSQFGLPYVQRASLDLVLLSIVAGTLGPWILMRGLGFFAHAIGTAAFPGLIMADAVGIAPQAGAALGASGLAAGSGILNPANSDGTRIALWLTGAVAAGALLASDISHPGPGVDTALFGSLLSVGPADLATAAVAASVAMWATHAAGPRWLAQGMLGRRSGQWDALLFVAVAVAVIAQLSATGALLASSLLILPAAAARPWVSRIRSWQALTLAMALLVAFAGLASALGFDTPPGATIALSAGVVVVASHIGHHLRQLRNQRTLLRGVAVSSLPIAALLLAGCVSSTKHPIVATTPIVGSITQAVAGPGFQVKTLVPASADPHSYEPRPSDTAALAGAKVIVTSGAGLDEWLNSLKNRSGSSATVVDLASVIPFKRPSPETDSAGMDPHWFHDPRNVGAAAKTIAVELGHSFPDQSAGFTKRAAALSLAASQLDSKARACTLHLTSTERNLVTDHDAFGYLASRLRLTVRGSILQSQSTSAAPSPRQLDSLAAQIKALKIKAIFPERALDPRLARNLATQSGTSSTTQLDADTLGPSSSSSGTWEGMWSGNVTRLVMALSGGRVKCTFDSTGAQTDVNK